MYSWPFPTMLGILVVTNLRERNVFYGLIVQLIWEELEGESLGERARKEEEREKKIIIFKILNYILKWP